MKLLFGCDGTVVKAGYKGGIIRLMDKALNKPLQWFICQLHSNELQRYLKLLEEITRDHWQSNPTKLKLWLHRKSPYCNAWKRQKKHTLSSISTTFKSKKNV